MTPALQAVLFGSGFYPGAAVALDFLAQRYRAPGVNSPIGNFSALPNVTITRATPPVAYAPDASGLLIPFAANTRRITSLGLLIEAAATNVVLWNRDFTNAAWTKTSITAALNQVGADGTANAASSLTATGANGTALQAITLASSARFQSAYVKRITGSGVVNMTMDNGATWTAITLTTGWTQVSIPSQTLANPTVGFRIVTSGDAIAVDFVQNETGGYASSPIPATTVAVTRALDGVVIAGLNTPAGASVIAEFQYNNSFVTGFDQGLWKLNTTNPLGMDRFSANMAVRGATLSADTGLSVATAITKMGAAFAVGDVAVVKNGGAAFTSAALTAMPTGAISLSLGVGTIGVAMGGFIRRFIYYESRLPNATLQAATL